MVIKEVEGHVRVLRLANPPANVLNLTLLATLKREISEAGSDPAVRCLLLASSYPRYFSTGLDLQELASLPPERRSEPFTALLDVYRTLRDLPKPTLASIAGSALLGGWILAMACDFRLLAEENGKISLSEIRFGLSPTALLVSRLRDISSSPSLVREMVLKGKTLRAREALAGGFVDRLVPGEKLQEEALHEARILCRQPLTAYASVKRALQRRPPGDESVLWQECHDEFHRLYGTPEALEGIAAIIEKRRPHWEH